MPEPRHHRLDLESSGLAVLTLDMEGKSTNVLSSELTNELEMTMTRLGAMKEVRGLLIRSGKPRQFIAGASIDEIRDIKNADEATQKAAGGQALMQMIEDLPYPSLAVIDGPCLGGGMELALACTYRVAGEGSHVKLGLPEVRLGIVPGFGGTQRMPKVAGLLPAIDLITSGKQLDAKRAYKMGLVDDYAASEILEQVGRALLTRAPKLNRPTREPLPSKLIGGIPPLRNWVFSHARKKALKATSGFYPAPIAALDVLQKTARRTGDHGGGYGVEAQECGKLVASPVSKSLIRIFQATEDIRRTVHPVQPAAVRRVGLIGAGVMGGGIAQLVSSKGRSVRLRDVAAPALVKAMEIARDLNAKEVKKRRINPREAAARMARIAPTMDWSGLSLADLVIEAVIEKMEVKQEVFRELDRRTRPDAVLATNTSALSISAIAEVTQHPERVIGMHFFNPVHRMPLVEIVRGEKTSAQTIATTFDFALALGKTPIVVADRPGFLVNRILGLYLNEACKMAEEGVPILQLEHATKAFGMPMGPFELMDEIGLDIAERVGVYLTSALSHFPKASPLLTRMTTEGKFGKKNKKGFYIHEGRKKQLDTEWIAKNLRALQTPISNDEIVDRLVLLMVNEAARCLQEEVAASVRDLDIGMILGTGFAPFRGGLLAYADARGLPAVQERLTDLANRFGTHFAPVPFLENIALTH